MLPDRCLILLDNFLLDGCCFSLATLGKYNASITLNPWTTASRLVDGLLRRGGFLLDRRLLDTLLLLLEGLLKDAEVL